MGKGTGLGLSTCYGIVKQSGGDISVYREPGRGTTFKIDLPRASGEEATASAGAPGDHVPVPEAAGPGKTILLVEDEGLVRSAAERILRSQGYTVLVARDPGEALLLCEARDGPIHLLVTDVVMPGMNGRELAERVVRQKPGRAVPLETRAPLPRHRDQASFEDRDLFAWWFPWRREHRSSRRFAADVRDNHGFPPDAVTGNRFSKQVQGQ